MEKQKENVRCKNCESLQTYVRIKDKQRVCRKCGFIENVEVKDGQNI